MRPGIFHSSLFTFRLHCRIVINFIGHVTIHLKKWLGESDGLDYELYLLLSSSAEGSIMIYNIMKFYLV